MKKIFLASLIAGLIISCQKEVSRSTTSNSYQSLSEFFVKNQKAPQAFTANSSGDIFLQTTTGTRIMFRRNAFVTLNDQPVTGDVSVEVKEILTPAEMILNRALTVSNGEPIESGGEFLVKVSKNGQQLKLAPGSTMKIKLPQLSVGMNNMQVFNGRPTNTDNSNKVNWVLNTNPSNGVFIDSFSFSRTLFSDSVEWVNCDRYLNEPRINYTVYPGNISGFDSLSVVVHISGRNTVMSVPWDNATSKFYSQSLIASNATVIGIGVKDRKLQASIMPVNLQNSQSVTLNFSPYTEEQLKSRLAQLH